MGEALWEAVDKHKQRLYDHTQAHKDEMMNAIGKTNFEVDEIRSGTLELLSEYEDSEDSEYEENEESDEIL